MLIYKNKVLYSKEYRVHKEKLGVMDRAIREEFMIGLNGFDSNMGSFFRGLIEQKIKMSLNLKIQWLASVWIERNKLYKVQGLPE